MQQDKTEAVRLYGLAAAQGNADGQCNLGTCYEFGKGVRQDKVEGARLYGLAAAQGEAVAQWNLGLCYEFGKGVRQDRVEAARLYGLAAAQGDDEGRRRQRRLTTKSLWRPSSWSRKETSG